MSKIIEELQKEIHENAKEKGFWEGEQNISEKLMLIVSEISEAMEAIREKKFVKDKYIIEKVYQMAYSQDNESERNFFRQEIKDTFEDELADACIRIFDLAEKFNIDLEKHIILKHNYNCHRPFKHGKEF